VNKAIVIDDEQGARFSLRQLIASCCPNVEVVASASSVKEAIALIGVHQPNVIFLDIEMPEQNGFNLLEHYDNCPFEVIFTTAYDEYAIRAIRYSALDYLLKPIQKNELVEAVERLHKTKHTKERLQDLIERKETTETTTIVLNSQDEFVKAEISDIVRFEADRSYTYVFFANAQRLIMSKPLRFYEELLEEQGFVRCHRSHLVNSSHIEKIEKGSLWNILMSNKEQVPVSHRKRGVLSKLLK